MASGGLNGVMKGLKAAKYEVHLLSEDPSCVIKRWVSTGCTSLDAIIGKRAWSWAQ